jgi:hypothetical protein
VAIWWTEKDIRKLAEDEAAKTLAGDRGQIATHKHIERLIRDNVLNALSEEFNSISDRIVDDAKASLQGKVSAIYRAQTDRLEKRLKQFEQDLEAKSPQSHERLSKLESALNEVSARYQNWIEEPRQEIEKLASDSLADFKSDLENIKKDFKVKALKLASDIEARMEEIIQKNLHDFVLSAVREHVRSAPFNKNGLSNKQLAAARGVSLRRAKKERKKMQDLALNPVRTS